MATAVDICNMALSLLGDEATMTSVDPPEGSDQAEHCARFYKQALQELLSLRPWSFATRRAQLAMLSAETVGEPSLKGFAVPTDCAFVTGAYSDNVCRNKIMQYEIETNGTQRILLADAKTVWIKYVSSMVQEGTFPPLFTTALVHRLASLIAGSTVPGTTGTQMAGQHIQLFEHYVQQAWSRDARQNARKERYIPRYLGDAQVVIDDVYN